MEDLFIVLLVLYLMFFGLLWFTCLFSIIKDFVRGDSNEDL